MKNESKNETVYPFLPLSKFQVPSHFPWLDSMICVEPGGKPQCQGLL